MTEHNWLPFEYELDGMPDSYVYRLTTVRCLWCSNIEAIGSSHIQSRNITETRCPG